MEPNSLPFNAQQWRPNGKELWQPTLLLVLILLFGFACSLSYLPLCPSGRCWKAVQWSWKLPPGWSRDSGYVSHEVLWGHGLPLTSKSHQRRSGNKKEKKKINDKSVKNNTQKIADCYYSKNAPLALLAATRHQYKVTVGGCTLEGWQHHVQMHLSLSGCQVQGKQRGLGFGVANLHLGATISLLMALQLLWLMA